MFKYIIFILAFFFNFIFIIKYSYTNEIVCIKSHGIPNHEIGNFPTMGNPNKFKEQFIEICFPKYPISLNLPYYIDGTIGVTLTGIPIRPGTADWYDKNSPRLHSRDNSSGLNLEAIRPFEKIFGIDEFNGHVDNRGLYHYHKPNTSLIINEQYLIGYAVDGFEILYIPHKINSSWQLKKGMRKVEPFGNYDGSFKEDYEFIKGSGDLDECNGKILDGIYRYFATETFPFFPRCLWGEF